MRRRHDDLPPGPERTRRVEFEYSRGGTLAYLAALDVHHARVFGRCAPTTGIVPCGELVEQVMTTEPYASARRVFWVVDNGSSHAGQASIVQRKVIKPANFTDLLHLEDPLLRFRARYTETASPFDWRYTKADLNAYLQRLTTHQPLNPAA